MTETLFPLILFAPPALAMAILLGFAAFHFSNAYFMGLNAFVWPFLATYPSVMVRNSLVRDWLGVGLMPDESDTNRLFIVYDGDCPFCANFVKLYSIRKKVTGNVELINARERPVLVRDFRSRGMEINEGMIVMWRGHNYFGVEGMHLLAILGDERGIVRRAEPVFVPQ